MNSDITEKQGSSFFCGRVFLLRCTGHTWARLAKHGFESDSWDNLLQGIDRAKQDVVAEIMI